MSVVLESRSQIELDAIIELRYKILRAPWNQPFESSWDEKESVSINAYMADENGKVIACGRLQENEGKLGQIRYMAVEEEFRGKGIGKQILDFLETRAGDRGFQMIQLQARENALKFYEGNGYLMREKSFLLWGQVPHYLMEKKM